MYKKRLMYEKKQNSKVQERFYIQPLDGDIYTWHFTILGCPDSPYEKGVYHGYFKIPADYPMSPPDIYFMNQSGRFHTNKKICLNITSYHKEQWNPAWTLRTMMHALGTQFLVEDGAIGSLRNSKEIRQELALKSTNHICSHCGKIDKIGDKIRTNK